MHEGYRLAHPIKYLLIQVGRTFSLLSLGGSVRDGFEPTTMDPPADERASTTTSSSLPTGSTEPFDPAMLTPVGEAFRTKLPTSKDVFMYDPADVPAQPAGVRFEYGLIGHDSSIVCDAWKEGTCLFTIRDTKDAVPRADRQVPHRPKPGVFYDSPERAPQKLFHRHSPDVLVCDYGDTGTEGRKVTLCFRTG